MKLEIKNSTNYYATIRKIDNIIPLEGCDNIFGSIVEGCHVIVSNTVKVGDRGVFFPVECQISDYLLKENNLYDVKEMNADVNKKGFFGKHGRVRCIKLRGHKSEGFWIPLSFFECLLSDKDIASFSEGDSFDTIGDVEICRKYFVKEKGVNNTKSKERKGNKKFDRIIEEQFKFHIDTQQLKRNIEKIKPNMQICISQKVHGSSFICSNVLCKKQLNIKDRIAKKLGVSVIEKDYENVYASRTVIKNKYLNKEVGAGFYGVDIWGVVNEELKPYLEKGMTIYGEVVGYLPNSDRMIQKGYDYGCRKGEHKNFIYRVTSVNEDGVVHEWSMNQIQTWCKQKGLNCVDVLYMGDVITLYSSFSIGANGLVLDSSFDGNFFVESLSKHFLEKKCSKENFKIYCNNDVWDEGIVIRIEGGEIESYKLKSFGFLEGETKAIDNGEVNIEDNQEEGE